jgi:sugar phosphate isomerase/epimerase
VTVHPLDDLRTAGPGSVSVGRQELSRRLGLNVPKGWFPTAPMLKGLEAAGFTWVQVHSPPRDMLRDRERLLRHAGALRATLETGGLHLVLHAPDDLRAGEPAHDRALDGLLDYAAATGARQIVYHGANFPVADGGEAAARVRDRAAAEEASLGSRARRLERLGVTLAIENLAPVHPSPPRLCHDPGYVYALVERLDSPRIAMTFDVGHAHIAASLIGAQVRDLLDPVLDSVSLFHVHDNLGARRDHGSPPGLDPLRLDLHLPPGSGRVPWESIAEQLLERNAPLVLEVHPPHRPEPLTLCSITAEVLVRDRPSVGGAPRSALASVPLG